MRRLSITSDTSSFSVISRASMANSFGSVRSFDSQDSFGEQPATEDVIYIAPESGSGLKTAECKDVAETVRELPLNGSDGKVESNPAWAEFTGFVHSPTAQFKSEFERLARMKGWSEQEKKQQFVSLLSSEVAFYWGVNEDKLEQYQEMCHHLSLTPIPGSVSTLR